MPCVTSRGPVLADSPPPSPSAAGPALWPGAGLSATVLLRPAVAVGSAVTVGPAVGVAGTVANVFSRPGG